MPIERFDFANSARAPLAALLERSPTRAVATPALSPFFTCGRDNLAGQRIAETLAQRGIPVLALRLSPSSA